MRQPLTEPICPKYGSRMIRTGRPISSSPSAIPSPLPVCRGPANGINTSGRITPARICVAPLTAASWPSREASSLKPALGHGDLAEAFGDDDGQAHVLGAGDGHAQVVAQESLEVLVIEAAGDDGRVADLPAPFRLRPPSPARRRRSRSPSCRW